MPECDLQDHKEKLQAPCRSNFQKGNDHLAWDVAISAATPLHCLAMRLYPCKKWDMTWSSSMAMYSVMHDIHDARRVLMERGWVALYLYATCKYSNHLTLEQWAFEYGLPFFYTHCTYTVVHNKKNVLDDEDGAVDFELFLVFEGTSQIFR